MLQCNGSFDRDHLNDLSCTNQGWTALTIDEWNRVVSGHVLCLRCVCGHGSHPGTGPAYDPGT